jgi:hypothetical protein
MYLPSHNATHLPMFCNTLTRSSQGVCQELVTKSTARATRVERSSWQKLHVICHICAMHLPRFRNALTGSSLGVCQELVNRKTARATRVKRSSWKKSCKRLATNLQRDCQGLEMYLPYHFTIHLPRFRNALNRSSQGVCQELVTRKHCSRHSS